MDWKYFFVKYVLETNLFNFILLVLLFAFCAAKFNLAGMINSMQEKIAVLINDVKQNRLNSEKALDEAKEAVKNIDNDIEKINIEAQKNAETISNKIIEDGRKQAENIILSADKIIEAEKKQIITNLIKDFSEISIEKSRENIVNMLVDNNDLHEKYINESIDKLDGLVL